MFTNLILLFTQNLTKVILTVISILVITVMIVLLYENHIEKNRILIEKDSDLIANIVFDEDMKIKNFNNELLENQSNNINDLYIKDLKKIFLIKNIIANNGLQKSENQLKQIIKETDSQYIKDIALLLLCTSYIDDHLRYNSEIVPDFFYEEIHSTPRIQKILLSLLLLKKGQSSEFQKMKAILLQTSKSSLVEKLLLNMSVILE